MNIRKAAILGCGYVGAASAFALMNSGLFSELILLDLDRTRAEGEALDIGHGLPFARPMKIYAGDYADLSDAAVIIVTAGAGQKPGETRLDLAKKNVGVFRDIMPKIAAVNRDAILLIVSNPVDVLTYAAVRLSGYPEHRVFGTGTVLDTARLKYLLGRRLSVDPRSVHAFILGEHGDSEIPAWSCANVSGIPLREFCRMRGVPVEPGTLDALAEDVKNSAYAIIEKKQATYYGIAMTVRRICEAIVRDEKSVLPVSCVQHGLSGLEDVALSLPAIVGKNGVETTVPLALSEQERDALRKSAATLRNVLRSTLDPE